MMATKPLLGYIGGKQKIADQIVRHFPEHRVYVEPFGGMAGVLMYKDPVEVEVYNDLSDELVNLFTVVRTQPDKLIKALELTPYSRSEYKACLSQRRRRKCSNPDSIEWARETYVLLAQSYNNTLRSTSWSQSMPGGSAASKWCNGIDRIMQVMHRLRKVIIECQEATRLIQQYNTEDTLVYADPPYVLSTRNAKRYYTKEMTDDQHQHLLHVLQAHRGPVVLSGYRSELYVQLELAGWVRREIATIGHSGAARSNGKKSDRVECLWLNPQCLRTRQMRIGSNLFADPLNQLAR